MTGTLVVVEPRVDEIDGLSELVMPVDAPLSAGEVAAVAGLVRRARDQGLALTGPDGLLKTLTKTVIGTALEEEMTGHLGYGQA